MVGRALTGFCCGTAGCTVAVLFEYSKLEYRARDLLNVSAVSYLALFFGPLLSGPVYANFSWRGVFLAAACFAVLNIMLVMMCIPRHEKKSKEVKVDPIRTFLR